MAELRAYPNNQTYHRITYNGIFQFHSTMPDNDPEIYEPENDAEAVALLADILEWNDHNQPQTTAERTIDRMKNAAEQPAAVEIAETMKQIVHVRIDKGFWGFGYYAFSPPDALDLIAEDGWWPTANTAEMAATSALRSEGHTPIIIERPK